MGNPTIEGPIIYPIDGSDLQAVAGTEPDWPPSTRDRRIRRLVALGLLDAHDRTPLPHHPFRFAAAAALQERPDLGRHLKTASHLPALASLPDRTPWFPAHQISGLGRHTWLAVIREASRAALVLRPGGRARLNPDLPAFNDLVDGYRDLYRAPPASDARGWHAFFQHGVETFWTVRTSSLPENVVPVGPGSGHPVMHPIAPAWKIAYRGPRILDTWDHLFVTIRAETPSGGPVRPSDLPTRAIGLLAATMDQTRLNDKRLIVRAHYYGVRYALDLIRDAYASQEGPIWEARSRFTEGSPAGEIRHA